MPAGAGGHRDAEGAIMIVQDANRFDNGILNIEETASLTSCYTRFITLGKEKVQVLWDYRLPYKTTTGYAGTNVLYFRGFEARVQENSAQNERSCKHLAQVPQNQHYPNSSPTPEGSNSHPQAPTHTYQQNAAN